MKPQEILDSWDWKTPREDRKEVYEVLMAQAEFGRFLQILKDEQIDAYKMASMNLDKPEVMQYYHGAAGLVDRIRDDIQDVLDAQPEY